MPGADEVKLHVELDVAFAESETLVGEQIAESPVAGDTLDVREIVPAKPLRLVNVMVEFADEPEGMVREDGLVETEKSITLTRIVTEWDSGPLAPVTVRTYVPAVEELKLTVAEPDPPEVRVTLAGVMDEVRPDGEDVEESETVPEKPPRLVSAIFEVPVEPACVVDEATLLEMVKSTTLTVMDMECDSEPLVPVTTSV